MFAPLLQEEMLPSSAKHWIYTFQKDLHPICPLHYTDHLIIFTPPLKKSASKLIEFKSTNTSQPACKPQRETLCFIIQAFTE